jgi:hypothetical protein
VVGLGVGLGVGLAVGLEVRLGAGPALTLGAPDPVPPPLNTLEPSAQAASTPTRTVQDSAPDTAEDIAER